MIVSSRSDAAQISSTLMSPRAVSICASMPTRDWRPVDFSIWVSSMSSACTSRRRLHLGQHQLVEAFTRALDDLDHVAVRPLGVPRVHAHAQDGLAPVERVDRVDDLLAGGRLLHRRDRVFEVEEHHVGAETGRLAHHLLARAGNRQAGAAGQVAGAFRHACQGKAPADDRSNRGSLGSTEALRSHSVAALASSYPTARVFRAPGGSDRSMPENELLPTRFHRRDALRLLGGGAGLVVLAACGASSKSSSASTATSTTAATTDTTDGSAFTDTTAANTDASTTSCASPIPDGDRGSVPRRRFERARRLVAGRRRPQGHPAELRLGVGYRGRRAA